MDIELSIARAPVLLAAGDETRVPVQVRNRSGTPLSVRLSLQPDRVSGWSHIEPPTVDVAGDESTTVDLVIRPPADARPARQLQMFTVQAEDRRHGHVIGRANGLFSFNHADRLGVSLTAEPGGWLRLEVTNRGDAPLTLRLEPRLEPARGRVRAEPAVLDVPKGATASAQINARPPRSMLRRTRQYTVRVDCRDATADDAAALGTAEATVTAPPRLRLRLATLTTVLSVLILLAGVGFAGWRLTERFRQPDPPSADASRPTEQVRKPYAMVDVFPRNAGPTGAGAAQAALARLNAAGLGVRMVDSTTSDDIPDPGDGLLVLLRDGFSSLAEAQAYCDRHRAIAPRCDVVS
jgi:hypothetical protein